MDETLKTFSPGPSAADAGKWIGRVLIAVILGEGIWGLIVSLTNNLVLPFLARTMDADVQSPLYLGKGDFNVPAVFISVLELCFAGMVAVILNSWVRRRPRPSRTKSVRVSPIAAKGPAKLPAVAPVQPTASIAPVAATPAALPDGQFWSPPEPSARPQVAAAPLAKAKPKSPTEVIYNSVGEPINPTEE
jgi:hypothetical protein